MDELAQLARTDTAIEAWEAEARRCARKASVWADRGEAALRVVAELRKRRAREFDAAFRDPPGGSD